MFAVALAAFLVPGRPSADLLGHGGMVRAIDFSADGRRVVTGSFDFTAIVWEFEDQREIAVLDGHAGPVTSVAYLADGRVVTAGDDWKVLVWRLGGAAPEIALRLEGHRHKVMSVDASADGRVAVSGGWDRTVRVWDLRNGAEVRLIKTPSPVNVVAMVGAGGLVAVGGHDRVVRLYDINTGRAKGVLEGHRMGITDIAVAPDGQRLLTASIDKTLRLWSLDTLKPLKTYERHDNQVYAVGYMPDGKSAISAGRDGYVIQWDLATGKVRRAIQAHNTIAWSVGISPDGRFVVSGSSDDSARVWHVATGDRIGTAGDAASGEPKPWLQSDHPGAELFKKCARCHALSENGTRRSGPHFAGLFGRRVGTVPGYRYSDALKGRDFVWNEDTLFKLFDVGPDKFLPGTKMPVQRVPNREKLAQLVDYLKELTARP